VREKLKKNIRPWSLNWEDRYRRFCKETIMKAESGPKSPLVFVFDHHRRKGSDHV